MCFFISCSEIFWAKSEFRTVIFHSIFHFPFQIAISLNSVFFCDHRKSLLLLTYICYQYCSQYVFAVKQTSPKNQSGNQLSRLWVWPLSPILNVSENIHFQKSEEKKMKGAPLLCVLTHTHTDTQCMYACTCNPSQPRTVWHTVYTIRILHAIGDGTLWCTTIVDALCMSMTVHW